MTGRAGGFRRRHAPYFFGESLEEAMLDGPSVAAALAVAGVSHVLWVPDSDLGRWEPALLAEPRLQLIRVCREGEAIGIATGLLLGGRQPLVVIQCTGLFEAGDALRNAVHDLRLPLFLVVGVRSYHAHRQGASADTCPLFTEPIMQTWRLPYEVLDPQRHTADDLAGLYRRAWTERRAGAALIAE